jgi:hypothetical protein
MGGNRTVPGEGPKASAAISPDRHAGLPAEGFPPESIFVPRRKKKVLLSEVVEIKTSDLPRRKPRIVGDDSFLAVIDDG